MLNGCFDSIENYLKFYSLKFAGAEYELVPFKSGGFELAGHIFIPLETDRSQQPSGVEDSLSLTGFKPAEYGAAVILLHGYLSHTGLLSKLIQYLIENGYAVAVFDLAGHGLSGGTPTAIDDFSQYTDSLTDFLNIIRPKLHGPYHIIGHSTGGAVVMDYLFSGRRDYFDKVILAAPLVRSKLWFLSKLGYAIYRPFAKNIFRVFRNVSSDRDFLRFVRYKDPLQSKKLSLNWTGALFEWNRKIAAAQVSYRPVMIVQGTCENIVSWRYNLKFIRSKFSNVKIKLVENVRHELFNESVELRGRVFSKILDYLAE